MSEECQELKNIKYQTMLLNGNSKITSNNANTGNIDLFLEKERAVNKEKRWNKLGKKQKIEKIIQYINIYARENKCTKEEKNELKLYLIKSLERKKLQRVKDVVYDSENGIIKNIPGLSFDKNKRRFTLKKLGKKKSSLSRTAPKVKRKTRIKKEKIDIHLKKK